MLNLVDEYKLIFVEKRGKAWNSPKSFCLYCSFLYICFEVCRQKTKSNLLRDWIFGQSFRMPNLMNDYKIIFLGKRKKRLNSSRAFSLYWSFLWMWFEVCLKPKSKYLRKIWSMNTKSYSWENEAKLQTVQKLCPHIGILYKFVLKSLESLNRILRVMEHWFKAL